ncbi:16S rRNA (guanine(527)-N(7))-methyltransferase RsmG [Demequina sp. TTPB684]|uniref:16S rRNA (guanine(527)-N(7))-methyltransferase RsmG n=1 Tax=unclassified Demequina TaxID=2620311 RepID=UPI001CF36F52|nr:MULTISPECIES: 16S rRNA (guanine(527)-N(7))-methyltransferase RsmG [unclassified Demequina]MCB2412667.1 16S rRNA (guanine(527)-N(7))-methyltransferase RsmG [Demequina sp. TTPB684]UPU87951.1 16S rRNA (guanine(527)-N(7))-methyltransferase RsmG [Demequina sp. TMPB413]
MEPQTPDTPKPSASGPKDDVADRAALTDFEALGPTKLRAFFGDRFDSVEGFAKLLADQGETRGLIGPRELDRLWERHILNSAAVVPFLGAGRIVDVGSGAGLPGLVIAAMLPDREVTLVEPMERRVAWLEEAAADVGLENVAVVRGRAEEVSATVTADFLTARAVASLDKLIKWCLPLVAPNGEMALLKGRSVGAEIERAKYALRKARLTAKIESAPTLEGLEPTTVVRLMRE